LEIIYISTRVHGADLFVLIVLCSVDFVMFFANMLDLQYWHYYKIFVLCVWICV